MDSDPRKLSDPYRWELRIPHDHAEAMAKLAADNDRTLSAEVRRAIREYLERNGKA